MGIELKECFIDFTGQQKQQRSQLKPAPQRKPNKTFMFMMNLNFENKEQNIHFNNFFIFFDNFLNSFHNDWNLDNLFDNVLNVFIDIDELRNNFFNFNNLWYFDQFLFDSFYFIDLWYNH